MTVQELDNGIRLIVLDGRLDVAGAMEIDLKFTAYSSSEQKKILVDLSLVEFLSSLGVRTLVSAAKSQKIRGGAFVLSGLQPLVQKVINLSGLEDVIPIVPDNDAGIKLLKGG